MPTFRNVQPAANAMNTLSSLMKQFLDNVNAGKLVTDVGPGLALTLPLLMLIAWFTDADLVPAQHVHLLQNDAAALHARLDQDAADIWELLLADVGARKERKPAPAAPRPPPPDDPGQGENAAWDHLERAIATEVARLASELTIAQRQLNSTADDDSFKRVDGIIIRKVILETKAAQIRAQRARLETVRQTLLESRSISKNLEIWQNHLVLVGGLAVVLGVIISQAARFLFFDVIFRYLLRNDPASTSNRDKTTIIKRLSAASSAAYQDLVTNHLRYAEGAVNMAVPVFLFGIVYPPFARTLHPDAVTHAIAVSVAAWTIGLFMIGSGFFTYRNFRRKEAEWLKTDPNAIITSAEAKAAIQASADASAAATKAAQAEKNASDSAKEAKQQLADLTTRVSNLEKPKQP